LLLIRPTPFSDESLESYIMRLAYSNGYIKASRFWSAIRQTVDKSNLRHINIPDRLGSVNPYQAKKSSSLRIKALQYLSTLSNQEPLPLLALSIFRNANPYSLNTQSVIQNGKTLPRQFVKLTPPICPDCLRESNYIRQIWSFWPYENCHKHKKSLISVCSCDESISVFEDPIIGACQHCGISYSELKRVESNKHHLIVSAWLANAENTCLPKVNQSHKYGLVLWWLKLNKLNLSEFNVEDFVLFFSDWPNNFHRYLEQKWTHFIEFGTKPVEQANFKDMFSDLLLISSKLPSSRFSENIILPEIYEYFNDNVLGNNNEFLSLKINSIEAAILLNTSTEQIAALVNLGELKSTIRTKSGELLSLNQYAFELGDLFFLWQAGFQTEYSNLSILTSRW
jgi:hypothetical protein